MSRAIRITLRAVGDICDQMWALACSDTNNTPKGID